MGKNLTTFKLHKGGFNSSYCPVPCFKHTSTLGVNCQSMAQQFTAFGKKQNYMRTV
jgi:hypothetical protein